MDKKNITAIIANDSVDKLKSRFTKESLQACENSNPRLPVTYEFDYRNIIGIVKDIKFSGGNLIAEIELLKNCDFTNKIFRIQGKIISEHQENSITIIDDFELISVGMLDKKQDVYL